jgi:hypothetical protein
MDAFLLLADAASQHPDGTFSVLRAGVDRVFGPAEPVQFRGALIARVKATLNETGEHAFSLRCTDFDGTAVMPPIQGRFLVPQHGGGMQFVVNCALQLPRFGQYAFSLLIDGQEQDFWHLTAVRTEPPHQHTGPQTGPFS